MSAAVGKKSDDVDIDLDNLDDLLSALTAEELEELNGDFDPDVSGKNNLINFCFEQFSYKYNSVIVPKKKKVLRIK